MGDIAGETGRIFNENSRTLAPEAVYSQIGTMTIVSLATIIVFNLLRPKNKIIYEPKVKYHVGDKKPPRISEGLCGWLPPLIHTKEPELVDKIGLDAVAFLRFLRLMRWLFTAISALACATLIPVNIVYNFRNIPQEARDILSILTIRDVGGDILYVHVAVTYLITLLIIGFVYVHWKEMLRLRREWFRSPEYLQSFYARTLAIMHVPKKYQSDEGLKAIFESVKVPYPTTSVHIGRRVGRLPELIDYHNTTVREFEEVLVKYLKGGKLGRKRPTIRIGATCGMGGKKTDAIDFYTAKLKRTEAAIEEYRTQIDTRKAENYGFASMAAVPYAHIVAKLLQGKHPKGTEVVLAPNPKDIIWENMNKSSGELARKRLIGFLFLALVCFFNTVPLFVISILANLDAIKEYIVFLKSWSQSSPESFAFISGVLPPVVSGIFGFFLPIVMRWLTQYMGALTHSRLDRAVIARYFFFLVISQLVIFTLIGVIFNAVREIVIKIGERASFQEIIQNLHTLPNTIVRTYINQASYWLTYFPLRGFLVVFDLAQIINLVWLSFKTHVFGRTPRDIREWTQPPNFEYAIYYSNILFMGAVGLVFSPLAPLVVVAATVVFWMSSWVYKYQLMFVFVSKVETGGRLWNVIINRLLFCVILMQLLMVLTIGLQYQFRSLQWISTLPPILFVIAFKIYINRTFLPPFMYYMPTPEELETAKKHSEMADARSNRLQKRFGHPALHADLFTPMLHAKMMPLLNQVYHGKIGREEARLNEYGGQKMEAQVVEGGIRIAAIDQRDLEYDPALYRRDRGELDWDTRSISSTTMFDGPTLQGQPQFMSSEVTLSQPFQGRERYLAYGPGSDKGHGSEIEMTPIDSPQEPLLSPRTYEYLQQQQAASQQTLGAPPPDYQGARGDAASLYRPQTPQDRSHSPYHQEPRYPPQQQYQYPPQPPQAYHQQRSYSPAPQQRSYSPAPQQGYPPQPHYHQQYYPQQGQGGYPQHTHHQSRGSQGQILNQFATHPRDGSEGPNNMAGRGTYRG